MLWMAIHFPHLALEVFTSQEAFADPEGKPAPVPTTDVASEPPFVVLAENRIAHRNPAARTYGIELGTTLATAHAICPQLMHVQADPTREATRLQELADALYAFSSLVSLQPPDCVLLEISGSLKLFGSHAALEKQAAELCHSHGHQPVVRTSATPWAAVALARSQCAHLRDVPLGLAGLELAGVKPAVIERFDNMGIYTLGPVLALPPKSLGRRFGQALLTYLGQLKGDLPDPRKPIQLKPSFSRQRHLLQPIQNKEDFWQPHSPLTQLAKELEMWLRAHQLGCERVHWHFYSHNSALTRVEVRFASGKINAAEILKISKLKIENTTLPEEVLGVEIEARKLRKRASQSSEAGLFNFSARLDQHGGQSTHVPYVAEASYELVDELNARLGEYACIALSSVETHLPEQAWTSARAEQKRRSRTHSPATEANKTQRPLWLFEPPRQVQRNELVLLHGPERIQTNWWSDTASRDYFVAQHRLGAECWAYVDADNRWYLHGYFG